MKNQTFKLTDKAYETPVCSVVELYMEGVLCSSPFDGSGFGSEGYENGDTPEDGSIF